MDRTPRKTTILQNDQGLGLAIARFCTNTPGGRQRNPKTESAYRCDLGQFGSVVGFNIPVAALDRSHIEQWLAYLLQKAYKPASMRRKIACVRGFIRQQRMRGSLASDPFDAVHIEIGREHKLTRILSSREFDLLLATADHRVESVSGERENVVLLVRRDQAMIWLLCGTGLRVGELVELTMSDADPMEGVLRVNGKGGRQRLAFMVDGDRERLLSYFRTRALFQFDHDRVFVNNRGRPITTEGVRTVVAKLARTSGLNRRITPHMLRHTAATRLLQHGANLRVVQEFLGHASIRMTERYTHVTASALREAVRNHSPLKRLSENL
ncbi:MAG: tyrosine-type recombinase/integrase [Planctomycetota bacterium]|nr:tyrosine-type recombinase/integrase [Planctomycetota bacterium]